MKQKQKKTWKDERDEKLRDYVKKMTDKIGLSKAYYKAMEKFGLSYPTVVKIYNADNED